MVRRTKEEAQATRSHLLDTAELLFAEHGVSRTSLAEIAAAAGLTRGAIYWHFKDKADLFNAMMERATLPMEQAALSTDEPRRLDPIAHLRRVFLHALRDMVHDPQVRRVFQIATHKVEYVGELEAVRDRHLRVRNECLAHFTRDLRLAAQHGTLAGRIPARAAAIGLHAMIDGLIHNWMLDPEAFDLVRTGERAIDTYLAGLGLAAPVGAGSPALRERPRRRAASAV